MEVSKWITNESKNVLADIRGKLPWDQIHGNEARYSGWGIDAMFEKLNKHWDCLYCLFQKGE